MAAQDELNQLERVFLRLGHAETDEQLQDIISKFLPPVLLKLSSAQEGVRKKVMELLVHVNKRIKSRPRIQLPVETLLVQYQDPAAASFVTNFTIIYIKMGYPRLDVAKQCELAPTLLTAMESKPEPQQDSLMHLLIPTLYHMKYPTEPSKASPFVLAEKPKTVHQLLEFMLDVLLMPYGFVLNEPPSRPAPSSPQGGAAAGAAAAQNLPQPPPGMSLYAVKRVIGEAQWSPEQLEQSVVVFTNDKWGTALGSLERGRGIRCRRLNPRATDSGKEEKTRLQINTFMREPKKGCAIFPFCCCTAVLNPQRALHVNVAAEGNSRCREAEWLLCSKVTSAEC